MNKLIFPLVLVVAPVLRPAPPARPILRSAQPRTARKPSELDLYLDSLKYDGRSLLSITEKGAVQMLPGKSLGSGSVIICKSEPRSLHDDLKAITILSPSAQAVFPGALVRINRNLAEGKPDLISLPRGPVKLSLNLPGLVGQGGQTVEAPTLASVDSARQEIEEAWFKKNRSQFANASLEVKKAYTSEQVALALGVNAKWGMGNAFKLDGSGRQAARTSTCIALFKQVYFTASVDPPELPSDVFDPSVTVQELSRTINASNPAVGYVKSMDYGRIILIRMTTSTSEDEADLTAAMNYATGVSSISSEMKVEAQRILNNSNFFVITLGGNAAAATQVMDAKNAEAGLKKLIRESATFDAKNPGYPISYTVNFLRDNSLATFGLTTDYTETSCKEYPAGYVRVRNEAVAQAEFIVTWNEKKDDGRTEVPRRWESPVLNFKQQRTLDLPGDATNVRIEGKLVTRGQVFYDKAPGPPNKCYRITGDLVSADWDTKCQ